MENIMSMSEVDKREIKRKINRISDIIFEIGKTEITYLDKKHTQIIEIIEEIKDIYESLIGELECEIIKQNEMIAKLNDML